ncbi:malic enzyme-like NAD(P)-binding protein [Streptomyces sp. NPDC048304]|uniref:malic enzyme-like NAD(P)-binding protein n=1 Tax=Streptomyces sp. NPDC048304 TaxID=3154820 RepID=UPI0033D2C24F
MRVGSAAPPGCRPDVPLRAPAPHAHRVDQGLVKPASADRPVADATKCAGTERPIVFLISNPTSRIVAMPADVIAWSGGKALVATGIPVPPVRYGGTTGQSSAITAAAVVEAAVVEGVATRKPSDPGQAARGITFGALDDETGMVDLIFSPPVWARCRRTLQ